MMNSMNKLKGVGRIDDEEDEQHKEDYYYMPIIEFNIQELCGNTISD